MSFLGAVAYFNSLRCLPTTQVTAHTHLGQSPFAGEINAIVSSVLSGSRPQKIFTTQINDTADVSNMHKTFKALEHLMKWLSCLYLTSKNSMPFGSLLLAQAPRLLNTPFIKGGYLNVPRGGLKTTIFPGLKGTYGDVFYHTMMETCVLNPVISATDNWLCLFFGSYSRQY